VGAGSGRYRLGPFQRGRWKNVRALSARALVGSSDGGGKPWMGQVRVGQGNKRSG
jgi:hypothetical protein